MYVYMCVSMKVKLPGGVKDAKQPVSSLLSPQLSSILHLSDDSTQFPFEHENSSAEQP